MKKLFPLPANIRRRLLVAATCGIMIMPMTATASGNDNNKNVVERIEKESNGNITIEIPQNILELILQQPAQKKDGHEMKTGINKLSGFRIQVFSDGRNQHTLEARAKARGSAILAKVPKYRGQIYTYSSSPNWYTRVGNFRTSAEANSALAELKKAFPNYASEMRVVKCQIVVIKP